MSEQPRFFATPDEWREWLKQHHQKETALWVGFHKKASGQPSIDWPQSVDEALCYGWIDGLRRGIDEHTYKIRFTPRRADSTWSAVNLKRFEELRRENRVQPAGLAIWESRQPEKAELYSYERQEAQLSDEHLAEFRKTPEAWRFFEQQPPGYRKTASWWVISAKKEETRQRRLQTLIEDSQAGRLLKQLQRPTSKG